MPSAHTIQDNDSDSHSLASDASESEPRPRTPHISQGHGPEIEKLTSHSRRRRRKTRRRTMGMERAEYIHKGNDPYDYEQKFPEDKQYEELGPAARVWRTYLEECAASDGEMVEGWRDGLDVLLVFAGLFSAVVTTFVAQTSQSLQVDYGEVTTLLLIELINVQRSASNGSPVNDVPRSDLTFHPSTSDSWANGLWFTSLSLSLTAALFAVLTKQWIHQYLSVPSGTPRDRCRVRQFRYMGLQQWGVGLIIGLLPVLMSASLAVFFVGLVVFIIPLRVSIASVVGAITLVSFSAYIVTNFLPVIYPSCPYKTPLSQYMFPIYAYIRRQIPGSSTARTLREAESTAVRDSADEMDVQALVWLINMSSNPSVENIVIESTSALPLKSVDYFARHIDHTDVFLACRRGLQPLFYELDVSVHESKVDRLLRATLRFTFSPDIAGVPKPGNDCLSPTLYVDLLYIHLSCQEEIRELVMYNLMSSDNDLTALHLQPIIWARLLQRVSYSDSSPDKLAVMQMLFTLIPSFYWKANYVRNTYALDTFPMELPYGSGDGKVTLQMAIEKSLYIYVAEDILHRHMLSEPTIFRQNGNDTDVIFYPYWRLCLLMRMAGSPTMRSTPDSYFKQSIERSISPSSSASNQSLFITMVERIGDLVDAESPHKDNDNRRPALEFLHTLMTSVEFDDSLTPGEQRSALMMFFRVLNCTSPRPPFPEKDWCIPQLATKFIQIALRVYDRPTISSPSFASNRSFFITMVESIGILVDIESPHKDNTNRRPALEFLHTLITSVEFDTPLTLHEQSTALIMFFRVLKCTSSRPPSLEKDWCTPQLATKFVQLTLTDSGVCALEICAYFLQHTSFTAETLASFVSDFFGKFRTRIFGGVLWLFLRLIITELGSEYLVRVRRQSLEYLHEPDNLFTSCTALIQWNDTQTLRRLALLHPEHGSWSGCIQRLEDSDMYGVADFKAFIQAGCVGAYGEDRTAPQEGNDRPVPVQHLWSTTWNNVQQFITGKPRRGGIESSRNDNRV